MGQKDSVYRKSSQGSEALARRDPVLTPRLRSLLIVVDGKRTLGELVRIAPTGAETEQLLSELHALGMLDVSSAPGPVDAAPAQAEAATAAAAPPAKIVTLPEAQRAAVRRLTDLLGPEADTLCLRIEAARTPQDLIAMLQRAETLVRSARGADAASKFAQHMQAYRPS